jgi:hypothetical protein
MPCYRPLTAYRSSQGRSENGRWPLSFSVSGGYKDMPVTVACGKCIGCRLERSKEWASRCVHESRLRLPYLPCSSLNLETLAGQKRRYFFDLHSSVGF